MLEAKLLNLKGMSVKMLDSLRCLITEGGGVRKNAGGGGGGWAGFYVQHLLVGGSNYRGGLNYEVPDYMLVHFSQLFQNNA